MAGETPEITGQAAQARELGPQPLLDSLRLSYLKAKTNTAEPHE